MNPDSIKSLDPVSGNRIRIQEGKNDLSKKKKVGKFHVKICWIFSLGPCRLKAHHVGPKIEILQNSTNLGFSYFFCSVREGSGAGSVYVTNGSAGPKNIRIRDTGFGKPDPDPRRQKLPRTKKKVKKFHVCMCWMFSLEPCRLKALHVAQEKIIAFLSKNSAFFELLQIFGFGHPIIGSGSGIIKSLELESVTLDLKLWFLV